MKSQLSFFILLLSAITYCYSQDPYYINYTIDDGLPSNEVYDIEIDNDGLLWFTTDRGISTYDSYEFINYTTYDGLGDNVNFEIFKDSDGVLWFFGYNGKVTLYEDGEFKQYKYNKELIELMKSVHGDYIKEVQQGKNNNLNASFNSQNKATIITFNQDSKPFKRVNSSTEKIHEIDSFTFHFTISNNHTYNLHPISFRKKQNHLINDHNKKSNINFIYDDNNRLWFSDISTKGLQKIDLKTNKIDTILHKYAITNLRKDHNNGYWITTNNKGIIYISNINISPINLTSKLNNENNYLKLHAFSDHLFCGTSSSSIIIIDSLEKSNEIILYYPFINYNIDQFQNIDEDQKLILTSYEVKNNNGKFIFKNTAQTKRNLIISNNDIISRTLRGCYIYSKNRLDSITIILGENITEIIEDNQSNIWIGTLNGLHLIENFDYSNPREIKPNDYNKIGRVSDITVDNYNNLWVSTIGHGIFIINRNNIYQFNTDNGLTTNIVNTIEVIDSNQIWVATNDGLNLLSHNGSLSNLKFIESFDQSDGLNTNYINDIIKWNGKIYVASPNGICSFSPNEIIKPSTETPIKIKSVFVKDSLITSNKLTELKYNENQITINYKGIRHNKSKSQKLYKYKLEKDLQSKDWIYTNDTEAIFENLEYGSYTFKVNACNKEGHWNKEDQLISFIILPHFTDIWWFRILSFFIIAISLLLIGYYFLRRYQQIKATELALEEARTRVKEAELSALRNQMNPHFIFNSLNTIQNFIFKKDVKKANYLLSKFSSLIRKSLNYSRLEAITISEEIQFLKDFIELEKVRFPELISEKFEIDENLNISMDKIPCLLLQPLIENSIKHGISKSNQLSEILVKFEALDNEYLKILISDTGKGMIQKVNPTDKHVSLGHQIVKDRIQILKSKGYPLTSFTINTDTSSLAPGYKVTLILPIL